MERSTVTYRISFESAGAGSALVVAGRGGGIVEIVVFVLALDTGVSNITSTSLHGML